MKLLFILFISCNCFGQVGDTSKLHLFITGVSNSKYVGVWLTNKKYAEVDASGHLTIYDSLGTILMLLKQLYVDVKSYGDTTKPVDIMPITIDSQKVALWHFYKPFSQNPDTIPCIMLVFDTSLQHYNNFDCGNCLRSGYDYSVTWQKGYSVFKISSGRDEYLDADKKPLSKNIIVWISKSLK